MNVAVRSWYGSAAPHRLLLSLLIGITFGLSGPDSFAMMQVAVPSSGFLRVLISLVLTATAIGCARLGFVAPGRTAPVPYRTIVLLVAGSAAAAGAVVLLVTLGAWLAIVLALSALAIDGVSAYAPPGFVRRVPAEVAGVLVEGVLLPLAAAAAFGGAVTGAPLAIAVPTALALVLASSLAEETSADDRLTIRGLTSTTVTAAAANAAATIAIVLVVAGVAGPESMAPQWARTYGVERSLLGVPAAAVALVFSWLVMVDRRPEWRAWRVRILVQAAGAALYGGLAIVMLAA